MIIEQEMATIRDQRTPSDDFSHTIILSTIQRYLLNCYRVHLPIFNWEYRYTLHKPQKRIHKSFLFFDKEARKNKI